MGNLMMILLLLIAVGGALIYIYQEKKKGHSCIGCPHRKECMNQHCGKNQKDC